MAKPTPRELWLEACKRRETAWKELQSSIDQFAQAELLFKWRTDHFREKHGIPDGEPLTVEAIMERDKDEQWRGAVIDCQYHAPRMTAFAASYQSAHLRVQWLETTL